MAGISACSAVLRRSRTPSAGKHDRADLCLHGQPFLGWNTMKVLSSLKSAKKRDKYCQVVRRRGRLYVINHRNPRYKARQG